MSLRDVFVIREEKPPLRVIPGGKPPDEEYGPKDRVGFLYDVDEEETPESEPHMIVGSRGVTPQHDLALEIEMAARELSKINEKLGQKMNFETFVQHVEQVREIVSSLRFEADRMLRLQDYL